MEIDEQAYKAAWTKCGYHWSELGGGTFARMMVEAYEAAKASTTDQPDGWTLIPNLITLEMQQAYFEIVDKLLYDVKWSRRHGRFDNQKLAYAAMLGAAPTPPKREASEADTRDMHQALCKGFNRHNNMFEALAELLVSFLVNRRRGPDD